MGVVTVAELSAGLLWPKLLRAPALASRPGSLVLGVLLAALAVLYLEAGAAAWRALDLAGSNPFATLLGGAAAQGGIVELLLSRPIVLLAVVAPLLALVALGGGAICRIVALDFCADLLVRTRTALAFALRRRAALLGAVLTPLVIVLALVLVVRGVGWLLHLVPAIGGIAHGLLLPGALLAIAILALYVLGHGMLSAAVVVEGTDGVDAIQRAYTYVLNRGWRFLIYLGLLVLQGVVATALLLALAMLAFEAALAWSGAADPEPGTVAAGAIDVWRRVVLVLIGGWVVSFHHAAGTLLYLLMRRVHDAMDLREVWLVPPPDPLRASDDDVAEADAGD